MANYDLYVRARAILKMRTRSRLPSQKGVFSMTFEGAVLKEQNVTFAVVAVKQHVVENRAEAYRTLVSFSLSFQAFRWCSWARTVSAIPNFMDAAIL